MPRIAEALTATNPEVLVHLDPITTEILIARFAEICATMEHVLFHSGYSTILRESHDGSSAICDIDGYAVDRPAMKGVSYFAFRDGSDVGPHFHASVACAASSR